jgi:hypothetical protein
LPMTSLRIIAHIGIFTFGRDKSYIFARHS